MNRREAIKGIIGVSALSLISIPLPAAKSSPANVQDFLALVPIEVPPITDGITGTVNFWLEGIGVPFRGKVNVQCLNDFVRKIVARCPRVNRIILDEDFIGDMKLEWNKHFDGKWEMLVLEG